MAGGGIGEAPIRAFLLLLQLEKKRQMEVSHTLVLLHQLWYMLDSQFYDMHNHIFLDTYAGAPFRDICDRTWDF